MKKTIVAVTFLCMAAFAQAQQVKMPAPSPTQTIRQDFGMGSVELTYSRPNLNKRSVFGNSSKLAPYGTMWRTGANGATKLRFTDNVTIGGKNIDTGTYVLYTIPAPKEWEVVLNKGVTNWGTDGYKAEQDVVRFKVPVMKMGGKPLETFTMQFADLKPESVDLHLMWGNSAVSIPISTSIKDRLKSQIDAALQGDKKPYWQAANFYNEWQNDKTMALNYVNKAIEQNQRGFWMYMLKAKIQRDLGDKAGARISAQETIRLATEAKNEDYVNQATDLLADLK